MPAETALKQASHAVLTKQWGSNIRARREMLGFRQDQLEEFSGVQQQTISKIERGRFSPSIDLLLRLAAGLGAEPAELFPWPNLRDLAS